jgi:hypothetical protein
MRGGQWGRRKNEGESLRRGSAESEKEERTKWSDDCYR